MSVNRPARAAADYWVVVPAAGVGRRFGGSVPKQYLALGHQPLICHTLQRLQAVPGLKGGVLALAADDRWWSTLNFSGRPWWQTVSGGAERCHSVLAALEALAGRAAETDWVLIHDVARPCILPADVLRLMRGLESHPVGGLLAVPLTDTVKLATGNSTSPEVEATLDRNRLWAAQTPQMFRFGVLRRILRELTEEGMTVTDEAAAVEHRGLQPRLVAGRPDNIKVTSPGDLAIAAAILAAQGGSGESLS